MILSAQFANVEKTAVVVITDDRGAVSISADRPALWEEYLAWPGVTAAFVPEDVSAVDLAALNAALAQEGSVVRALSEIVFGLVKGTIPVTPSLTKQQFVTMLRAKMRTP